MITVSVFTDNITYDSNIENEYESKLGASINLTSATNEISFKGIDNTKLNEAGFVEYTMYLCLSSEITTTIELGLGCEEIAASGTVYFDNLQVTELADKAAYTTSKDAKSAALYVEYINYTPTEEADTPKSDEYVNNFNWLTIPSIITAVAILVAVIGFYVKKINIKVTPKIKTSYDRRKTLDKSIDRKEKIALRKQIIEELTKELEDINKELEDFKTLSNKKIEELKAKVETEKESIQKHKFELEIRRKEYVAEREKNLKANPELIKDKKAEREFTQ